VTTKNPQKTSKKASLRPSSGLRLRIDEQGLLRARVSASAGEFNLTPEIVQLLCLVQQGVQPSALSGRLRQDFREIVSGLPHQEEIDQLLVEMKAAQCLVDASAEEQASEGLLDGFGDPWIQWAMLADAPRCAAYEKAIKRAVNEKSKVVDVGSGTGLLSLYALAAGAQQVDAIEETASAKILKRVKDSLPAKEKQRLLVHHNNSSDVQLPADATHIVSELFGNDPFQEGVVPTLRDIFSRLGKNKVKGIPESVEIFAQLVELQHGPLKNRLVQLNKDSEKTTPEWQKAVMRIKSNLDLSNVSFAHPIRVADFRPMGSLKSMFNVPLAPPPGPGKETPRGKCKIVVKESMQCPVLLLGFRAHLNENISISNLPGEADQCDHWSPIVVPIRRLPAAGESLELNVGVGEDWEQLVAKVTDSQGRKIGERK
jgi:predicted RNA methylase